MIGADAVRLAQERFGLECPPEGPLVPRERLVELARALYDELGYVYLSYITAVHHPEETKAAPKEHGNAATKHAASAAAAQEAAVSTAAAEVAAPAAGASPESVAGTTAVAPAEPAPPEIVPAHYFVVYRVRNLAQSTEFPFRCRVPVGTSVPSLAFVWAGADWQEREAFDLVGPVFEGHPDLRRIMLPEDWEGHPLQRQYAIDTPHRPWR